MSKGKYHPWMRDDQIVTSWRDARNRAAQVKILAELNAVPRNVIEEILIAHGCEVERKKKPPERAEEKSPWREQDDERLMALHGEGRSYAEIAEKLERTVAAIKQRIVNLKRKEREKQMNGNSWTSDEIAFMLERRKQGVDVRHIAAEMGRTVPAIQSKLKKLREEGKKIAAEIEAEEAAAETETRMADNCMPREADEALADKIIRMIEDYKAAAKYAGAASEIHIDATSESVVLHGSGNTVYYMKETFMKKGD